MSSNPYSDELRPLLDEKGRLLRSSWAEENVFSFQKDTLSTLRYREWELYQLLGENFVFRLLIARLGSVGVCRTAFTDLKTGEYSLSGPLKTFSGDDFSLDFVCGQPHHVFRDEDAFFLSLDYDGSFHRLRCYDEAFDVELMLPDSGKMLVSASPFENLRHFFFTGRKVFSEFRGAVSFRGKSYPTASAFVSYESGRAVLPLRSERVFAAGSTVKEGHSLSFVFGWGFGYSRSSVENAVFLDGEILKLNRVLEEREGDLMKPARFYTEEGNLELSYTPWRIEDFSRDAKLLFFRESCTVGRVSGTIKIHDIGTINIDSAPMLCEHGSFRF